MNRKKNYPKKQEKLIFNSKNKHKNETDRTLFRWCEDRKAAKLRHRINQQFIYT